MKRSIITKEKFKFHIDEILYLTLHDTKYNSFFKNEIICYLKLVQQFGRFYRKKGNINSQYYKTEFVCDDKGICTYEIEWSIDSAIKIIQRDNIQPISLSVNDYRKFFHEDTLDGIRTLLTGDDNTPVIVVEYKMIDDPKLVLIDGNHRFYNAMRKGKKAIPAYRLSIAQSLECMQNDTFRDLYKVHHNLIQIILAHKNNSRDLIFAEDGKDKSLFQLHYGFFSKLRAEWLLLLFREDINS